MAEQVNKQIGADDPSAPVKQQASRQENLTAANAAAQAVGNDDGGQTPLTGGSDNAVKGGSVQQEKPTAPKTNQKGGF